MIDDTAREERVREVVDECGLRLVKSPGHDPGASDYGRYILIESETNAVVFGHPISGPYGSARLNEVEDFLQLY